MLPILFYYEVEKLTDSEKIKYYDSSDLVNTIQDACEGEEYSELFSEFWIRFVKQLHGDIGNYQDENGKYIEENILEFYNHNKDFFLDHYDEDVFNAIVEEATKAPIDDSKEYPDVAKISLVINCIDEIKKTTNSSPKTLYDIAYDDYPYEIIHDLEGDEYDKYKIAFINEVYFGNSGNEYMWEYLENRRYEERSEFLDYYNSGEEKNDSGDYQGAIEDYTKAIEIETENYESYVNRGKAKECIGDIEGAIIDYTKAKEIHPHLIETINLIESAKQKS